MEKLKLFKEEEKEFKLSGQFVGCLMIALQNCIANETDILPVLQEFKVKNTESGLIVLNPPIYELKNLEKEE